jgi:hypothetical protein
MRAFALAFVIVCTACTQAQYAASVNSGTVVNTSSVHVQANASSVFGIALVAATIAASASQDPGAAGTYPGFTDWIWSRPPPMNPDRAIAEQDCTKPIVFTENLRCR